MNQPIEMQIKKCEEQLRHAILHSDIPALDKLLSDDLTFTNHLGQLMTKQNDLDAHKSKILNINKISFSDQKIQIYKCVAIVTVQAHITGSFDGEESENNFRFTRV